MKRGTWLSGEFKRPEPPEPKICLITQGFHCQTAQVEFEARENLPFSEIENTKVNGEVLVGLMFTLIEEWKNNQLYTHPHFGIRATDVFVNRDVASMQYSWLIYMTGHWLSNAEYQASGFRDRPSGMTSYIKSIIDNQAGRRLMELNR